MGLTNDIGTKENLKCPKCGESLRFTTTHETYKDTIFFQSKDMNDRGNCWMVGDQIIKSDGDLEFISVDDAVWEGFHFCPHCRTPFGCDIIIKKGFINSIENLRECVL